MLSEASRCKCGALLMERARVGALGQPPDPPQAAPRSPPKSRRVSLEGRPRATFATVMAKRIFTLAFDRSTTVTPALRWSR